MTIQNVPSFSTSFSFCLPRTCWSTCQRLVIEEMARMSQDNRMIFSLSFACVLVHLILHCLRLRAYLIVYAGFLSIVR